MSTRGIRSESARGKRGNGSKNRYRKRGPLGRSALSLTEVTRDTPLERYRRRRAVGCLRLALAQHQPVVKRCVAERLCHHRPVPELARELFLSEDQVRDILERMRPWVHRFTTFFDSDWYWVDGGAPSVPGPSRS